MALRYAKCECTNDEYHRILIVCIIVWHQGARDAGVGNTSMNDGFRNTLQEVVRNALESCLLEGLGIHQGMVGASSALEANGSQHEATMRSSEIDELLMVEGPRHTPAHQRRNHLGL